MKDFTDPFGPIRYFFPLCVVLMQLLFLYEGWAWLTQYVGWVRVRVGYWPTISELSHTRPWFAALIFVAIVLFGIWWAIHWKTLH